ncbi:mannose-1-phosphate guanylyltransferase/mannose-6-phosphate isomerase [Megalodesulfovibrio paquesii]
MSDATVPQSTTRDHPLGRCQAVILAGGSGTRLWPLSRAMLPKQLLALKGSRTLLQETVDRSLAAFPQERIHVVTNEEHIFEVKKQLKPIGQELTANVLSEPIGRNTLPAILLAMASIADRDPEALVAVFPSDHFIHHPEKWTTALARGCELAAQGWFVTFGIIPDKPETGYGYINKAEALGENAFRVAGFVEKPDLERAKTFVSSGDFFWNSGMFVFSLPAFLEAVERYQPELFKWWQQRGERPLVAGYGTLPDISVDYGIMEQVDRIAMVAGDFGWDDLGSWEALYRLGMKDEQGCVVEGDVLAVDCKNSLLFSRGAKLAAAGVENIIVVQTKDATLVCSMEQVQKVKDVVQLLKTQGSPLVTTHVTVHRPWGSYTVLEESSFYKLKRIVVLPGAKLSLQMHHHRSEHWVVISGTALVQVGEEEKILVENQSVDIPKATKHRLSNPGKVPVEIIEIQNGPYLEEDDIVRFEDVYGRKPAG